MILPGAASWKREVSEAWWRDRNARTPRANAGSSHTVCSAVMIASRPKGVEYQGMPAYGYGPVGSSVVSNAISARERSSQSLNIPVPLRNRAPRRRFERARERDAAAAVRKRPRLGEAGRSGPISI